MKRLIPIIFTTTLVAISAILLFQQNANTYNAGPPAGRTGAPGETTCATGCHTGASLNSGIAVNSITTNIPSSGFVGGETYTVTVTSSQAGISKFGFEISAENASGSNIGTWVITNTTRTKIVSTNYVTHTSSGTSGSGSNTWSMNWKAPCAGQDTVIFYSAVNVANGNGFNSGDTIYTIVRGIDENVLNVSDTVGPVVISDIGDNYDGRDLKVAFKTSKCESRTDEYRLIAVKAAKAATFTIASAGSVSAGNYITVNTGTPNTNKTKSFGPSGKDSDGDPIRNNEEYSVFVLSVGNSTLVSNDTMRQSTGTIILTSPMVTVSEIEGSDVSNNGNASDLEVSFKTPSTEIPVSEYRSIIVKSSAAASFTKAAAQGLTSNLYKVSNVGMSNTTLTVNHMPGDMDSDGDTLVPLTDYKVFVLTVADGINSLTDSMAESDSIVSFDKPIIDFIAENTINDVKIQNFNSEVLINMNGVNGSSLNYEIYSLTGRLMSKGVLVSDVTRINLSPFDFKIGILRLTIDNQSISHKIIR